MVLQMRWFLVIIVMLLSLLCKAVQSRNITCSHQSLQNITKEEIDFTSTLKIHMSPQEKVLLWREIREAKVYFEYGSGGSTELACRSKNIERLFTVDSSKEFLMNVINNSTCLKDNPNVTAIHIDIGKTLEWGFPEGNYTDSWLLYPEAIHNTQPSVVLVDGRFRVACMLQALLSIPNPDLHILVHDFTDRKYYHDILKFVDIIDCIDTLVVLKRKHEIKPTLLQKLYKKYSHDVN